MSVCFDSVCKHRFLVIKRQVIANTIEAYTHFDGDEVSELLRKAITRLPEKQRLVFNMKYFDDMKYEDISAILGTSVGGLKASYHLAVKKIEQFIEEHQT